MDEVSERTNHFLLFDACSQFLTNRLRVVKKTNDSRFLSRGRTKKPTNAWPASERNMDIVSFARVKSPNSPPEWITTTCKRNAASMDGNCSEQRTNVAANTNGAEDNNMYPDVPMKLDGDLYRRKRRRASRDDSHGLKTSQVIKVGTKEKHHLVETKAGKHEKKRLVGGSKSENRIHFVVQDYARSAMFVEATQRRRGKTNIRNVAGTVSSQRRLFEDNTQSNCSSPSVAAGLMEAVSPACEPNTYLKQKDNSSLDIGRAAIRSNWNPKLDRNGVLNKHDCGAARLSVESRMPGDSLSVDENDEPVQKSGAFAHYQRPFQDKIDYMVQPSVVGKKENVENSLPPKPKSISEPIEGGNLEEIDNRNAGVGQSASILSLPHCASFSGETQNREFSLIGNNTDKTTQMPNEFNSSPTQRDHHETFLGVWRAVMEQEKKGNQSSFRYALASLIVAKNEKNASEDVWLPDLLEDKFSK
eukprot:scaffold3450_cov114-Cylindrotheca_fusiformis.AAC.42